MKKIIALSSILMCTLLLSACGPRHHYVVKPKPVILAPPVKQVVLVAPVKAKHKHKWHRW